MNTLHDPPGSGLSAGLSNYNEILRLSQSEVCIGRIVWVSSGRGTRSVPLTETSPFKTGTAVSPDPQHKRTPRSSAPRYPRAESSPTPRLPGYIPGTPRPMTPRTTSPVSLVRIEPLPRPSPRIIPFFATQYSYGSRTVLRLFIDEYRCSDHFTVIWGQLSNLNVQPNATINPWIAAIHPFDFKLVHIP